MQAFTRQYMSQSPVDFTALPYYDLCAILRLGRLAGTDLPGWVSFFEPYGRSDNHRAIHTGGFSVFCRSGI